MKTSHLLSVCVALPFSLTVMTGSAAADTNAGDPCLSDSVYCGPTNTVICKENYANGYVLGTSNIPCTQGVPIPSTDQGFCNIMCFGTTSGGTGGTSGCYKFDANHNIISGSYACLGTGSGTGTGSTSTGGTGTGTTGGTSTSTIGGTSGCSGGVNATAGCGTQ